jgi:hypothetical protein
VKTGTVIAATLFVGAGVLGLLYYSKLKQAKAASAAKAAAPVSSLEASILSSLGVGPSVGAAIMSASGAPVLDSVFGSGSSTQSSAMPSDEDLESAEDLFGD